MERSIDNIIYGIHAVEELISARINEIERIYVVQEKSGGEPFEILKLGRRKKIPCQVVPAEKLDSITGTTKHQGVAAICSVRPYEEIEDLRKRLKDSETAPLLLIPASIEDPGNLGAIIRTAVGLNVDAILLERKRSVPINATVAKTSAGLVEQISLVKPRNLEGEIKQFVEEGYQVIGATAGNFSKPQDIDFSKPTIIITGGEHRGIPPYLSRLCTGLSTISINSKAESFNVSVAAAIMLYEVSRQRGL
jgi:23S rRNA (guanosine2251-2'-O)-methyltransferase